MKLEHLGLIILFLVVGTISISLTYTGMPEYVPPIGQQGSSSLKLEVANTQELRAKGLSGHVPLKGNIGMLFVFEEPQNICLWNKDVDFPISVGFFNNDWEFLGAIAMKAHSVKKVCSNNLAKYAIEMQDGWFGVKSK
jgi:uncharacterized protein